MEAKKFVTILKERVIENDNKVYQNLLDETIEAKDPTWQAILPIYKSMNKNQKVAFIQFLRIIQVNTLSRILGALDGTTSLTENSETFILKTEENDELINGDLQKIFLGMEDI